MNKGKLTASIKTYLEHKAPGSEAFIKEYGERQERVKFYQSFNRDKILGMDDLEFAEYMSRLWAMLIWGNKRYVIDRMIGDNGFEKIKKHLADFLWGDEEPFKRWDSFREKIKHIGPAMMSELLCLTHPERFIIWNRRAFVGLQYLEVSDLPASNYQVTGEKYLQLCDTCGQIRDELESAGYTGANYLLVDYFIWEELQVEPVLARIPKSGVKAGEQEIVSPAAEKGGKLVHDEVRDKLAEIGAWLGFKSDTEVKVGRGAVVDAVWESTIGNMGRVIYVFEVQHHGSIDGMLMNMLKALNNPSVQAVVAVSDEKQLETIAAEASQIQGLSPKLRMWDFQEVLKVHNALEGAYESINKVNLIPQGF